MALHGPKIQKDLFGLVLHGFLHGDKTSYAVVRDDGWVEYPNDPAEYFHVHPWYVQHARGKILDVGCGSGSIALALQAKGFDVHGIDTDAYCVQTCKERGLKSVWQESILHPLHTKGHRYDTIILAGNNLGIAGNPENLKTMLQYLHSITTDDGIILGEGLNFMDTTNTLHKNYHTLQSERGRYAGIVTIRIDYKDMVGEWFDWMHTPVQELTTIAKASGWSVEVIQQKGEAHYKCLLKKLSGA